MLGTNSCERHLVSLLKRVRNENSVIRSLAERLGVFVPKLCGCYSVRVRVRDGRRYVSVQMQLEPHVFSYRLRTVPEQYSGIDPIAYYATDEAIEFFVRILHPSSVASLHRWAARVLMELEWLAERMLEGGAESVPSGCDSDTHRCIST